MPGPDSEAKLNEVKTSGFEGPFKFGKQGLERRLELEAFAG
jgi:hypothetical protein